MCLLSPVQAGWFDWLGGGEEARQLTDIEQAKWALFNKDSCCNSLSQLNYFPLPASFSEEVFIDVDAQVFEFKTGKSFVLGYRLPQVVGSYSVELESLLYNDVIFSPSALLLDNKFNITRVISSNQFTYIPEKMFNPNRLNAVVNVNGFRQGTDGAETYLILFTTAEDLEGSTQMISTMRLFAETQGRADPGLPDPIAPHSAVGKLRVTVRSGYSDPTGGDAVDQFFKDMFPSDGNRNNGEQYLDLPAPSEVPDRSPTPGLTSAVATGNVSMLPETEDLYNNLIAQAVEANDIDKALKLVEEAERAGSSSARTTFIDKVKNMK
ncbi:MalM family protein [Corallincola holothuriorum]|uniref:MalM family protein n=1 Tax=Corallincola holothuriorum TaxID=2282215 RepID=UPI00131464D7|nr:MalM family protein [Corallincola holothuriorum]